MVRLLSADMGHPEPFNLKYLGVGNEQWDYKDNTTFDQIILEHNKSGSHWIHVSCKPNPDENRHQVISTLLKKSFQAYPFL